ncbi:MAG TPA: hypothetical protein VFE46_15745 [Pirellulales bacterium]|jgi:hypothetical protein|nr:hypothetical protein [Pirellulales bacterium]
MQFSPDHLPPEVARMMDQLHPEPLQINRDELFFQAGRAAASSRHTTRHVWPAAAAALFVIGVGLCAALVLQGRTIDSLRLALADSPTVGPRVAQNNLDVQPQASLAQYNGDRFLAHSQLNWLRLASATPLPPGRLTAMGWEELPPEAVQAESAIESMLPDSPSNRSAEPNSTPHRPATYLELMRQQREG